jgi:hypothetical protein
VRVDPPLCRRMQTYHLGRGRYSAIVAPSPHPLSSPPVTLPLAGLTGRISIQQFNLFEPKKLNCWHGGGMCIFMHRVEAGGAGARASGGPHNAPTDNTKISVAAAFTSGVDTPEETVRMLEPLQPGKDLGDDDRGKSCSVAQLRRPRYNPTAETKKWRRRPLLLR